MAYRDTDLLNRKYGISDALHFERNAAGMALARINTESASATISLFGGQVLEWTPRNSTPVLWLSELAQFTGNKAIRGGIPICWPWFGAHPSDPDSASHGFARLMNWRVAGSCLSNGNVVLELDLPCNPQTLELWPYRYRLTLAIEIGATLSIHLCTTNLHDQPIRYSEALHSYFHTSNILNTEISGLEDTRYIDQVDEDRLKTQPGPVRFHQETDRIYLDTEATTIIHGACRRINIAKQGSRSTVVWNPWTDKAAAMADFPDEGWPGMLCVETANAADNSITLAPGESHTLSLSVFITPE